MDLKQVAFMLALRALVRRYLCSPRSNRGARRRQRADWSRPLPRPLIIRGVMQLSTLADVRELLRHLPDGHRERPTWRYIAAELGEGGRLRRRGRRVGRAADGAVNRARRPQDAVNASLELRRRR